MITFDLCDAIRKARGQHEDYGFHYAVIQRKSGVLKVVQHSRASRGKQSMVYTTRSDKYHTVLPEVR